MEKYRESATVNLLAKGLAWVYPRGEVAPYPWFKHRHGANQCETGKAASMAPDIIPPANHPCQSIHYRLDITSTERCAYGR